MFVVFEGIDGGGKTTISNQVAARLRAQGLSVAHARADGTLSSSTAQAIRELGRDARNVLLAPLAELLLYAARDVQSIEEVIVPALATADVVIADRHLDSAELLATVRGVRPESIAAILAPLRARAHPDLSILIDVDPDLARARRRTAKLRAQDRRPPSRKGLAGAALQLELRGAYRALAERQCARWLIVDNDDADLSDVVDAIAVTIGVARRTGVAAGLVAGRALLPAAQPLPTAATRAEAGAALLAWSVRRAAREPEVAAYVLAGLDGHDVELQRRALAPRAPHVVAAGLHGLADRAAYQLRHELAAIVPDAVARSLTGMCDAEAWALREALIGDAPEAVCHSLNGLDDERAWRMRDHLRDAVPDAFAASLALLPSPRAEHERAGRAEPDDYLSARTTCRMIAGRDDAQAWRLRRAAAAFAPVEALTSLEGVDDDEAWRWRMRYAERAPRPVAQSLHGMTQPAAAQLRSWLAARCCEAIDSAFGLDGADAWALRDRLADTWPASVCASLGPLAAERRGGALIDSLLGVHRGLRIWRHASRRYPADHHRIVRRRLA